MECDTAGFDSVLARLSAGAERFLGDPHATIQPFARLERPFSTVLRLRISAGGRAFSAFLKLNKPRQPGEAGVEQIRRWVVREYEATARLHEAVKRQPGLNAVRPIAAFPEELAILTEEVQGEQFDRILRRALWGRASSEFIETVAERIGEWIRTYQRVTKVEGTLSLAERREYLDVRLRQLTGDVITPADREHALRRGDDLAPRVSPADLGLVAIHADLNPTNILVGAGGAVTILDFAMAKTGARYHDIAHLFLHMERLRWRPHPRRSLVGSLQAAVLRGYDDTLTPSDPLFGLMLLQHAACYISQLAERDLGVFRQPYRALLKHRWNKSLGTQGLGPIQV